MLGLLTSALPVSAAITPGTCRSITGGTTTTTQANCPSPSTYTAHSTTVGTCNRNTGGFGTTTGVAQRNCPFPGIWTEVSPSVVINPNPTTTSVTAQSPACIYDKLGNIINLPCVPTYTLLTGLPDPNSPGGTLKTVDVAGGGALGNYLNVIIKLAIGIAAVLAFVMIVMGGIQYMTTELISSKEEGKKRITNAIMGLLVAFSAWLILFTINPKLLETNLNIAGTTIQFTEGPELVGTAAICGQTTVVKGQTLTSCNGNDIITLPLMGHQVQVNKILMGEIQGINNTWANSTDPKIKNYKITSISGYNPRSATGTVTTPSAHAFGLALDINGDTNPYSDSTSPCTTDMSLAFVQLFTNRGFGWGGYWTSKKDTMHFSKLSNESGYAKPQGASGSCAGLKP